jgi:anti-sigma-K factor RskA
LKQDKNIEEKQEQAALYALGSLSQHEARAFEARVSDGDNESKEALATFEKVVEALGYSTNPVQPPAYLKDVLQSRLQRERQQPVATTLPFPEKRAVAPATPPSISTKPATVVEFKRKSPALSFIPWALAASLAVCSLLAFFAWRNSKQENATLQNQVASIKTEVNKINSQAEQERERVSETTQIIQALRAPDHKVVEMPGQAVAPNASASLYWNVSGKQWVVAANLPPAPEGKVYQLWFVTPEAKISAGLLKTDAQGHGFTVVNVPADVTNVAAAAITLEPTGGSQQPTSAIYTLGKIS